MNPDIFFSTVPIYPWEILKSSLLDENRLSQVLFIDTELLCDFSTLKATKTHHYFNSCRENMWIIRHLVGAPGTELHHRWLKVRFQGNKQTVAETALLDNNVLIDLSIYSTYISITTMCICSEYFSYHTTQLKDDFSTLSEVKSRCDISCHYGIIG